MGDPGLGDVDVGVEVGVVLGELEPGVVVVGVEVALGELGLGDVEVGVEVTSGGVEGVVEAAGTQPGFVPLRRWNSTT
ncbi:hypothetical protein [Corynebacterium heidelbergense]|uniref:hypothetical protein n=1 Tax=Corynebacterium heidelbergense TaxID=2055947 RepID=UPI001402FF33|nr:hypothetical protein [Corynebacterium heidelbergense]